MQVTIAVKALQGANMAIGGMSSYGATTRDPYTRIEPVRPIERRKDDRDGDKDAYAAKPLAAQKAATGRNAGTIVDLLV
jgi:hypothetical protein